MYIGNMSVHWSVVHEDEGGRAAKLAARPGQAGHPTRGHDVHVDHGAKGRDPVSPAQIGRRKGHAGHFRVQLRFEREADARAAAAAAQRLTQEDGTFVLVLDVPVIQRRAPEDSPAAEVRVDW
jgi:hypothetical protein